MKHDSTLALAHRVVPAAAPTAENGSCRIETALRQRVEGALADAETRLAERLAERA